MKGIVTSFAATALIQIANIGSGVLLARLLLPEGRGELAAIMLWPMLVAALGIFGIHEAVAYLTARRGAATAAVLRAGVIVAFGLSAVFTVVGAVVVDRIFANDGVELRFAAFLLLAIIPLNTVGQVLVAVFQGRQIFAPWNLLRTMLHVLYLALIPLAAIIGFANVLGFAMAFLLSMVATIAVAAWLALRNGWFAKSADDEPAIGTMREILRYGSRVHFGTAVAVIAERLDQMIISIALSAADLGLYVVALTLARLPLILAITLGTVAFPKVAAVEHEARHAILGRYARATAGMVAASIIALAVAAPTLLRVFFGESFAPSQPVALVLLMGAFPLAMKTVFSFGLKACDRGAVVGQAELVALAVSAAVLAVLVPQFGLIGAAAASPLAQGGALVYMLFRMRRDLGFRTRDLFVPRRADLALVRELVRSLRRRSEDAA